MAITWEQLVQHATDALPGTEESTWYRTPALKVAGKGYARLRTEAEGGLVLMCSLTEKEALLACCPALKMTMMPSLSMQT